MANIDDAFRIDKLSLNDNILVTEGQLDPSTGAGYEAPIGSLYFDSLTGAVYHKHGPTDTDWNRFGEIDAAATFAALHQPTGFVSRVDSSLSIDTNTRTFSINVRSPHTSYTYYIKGQKYVISTTKSVVIPDITGLYYIYFDGTETLNYMTSFSETLLTENAIVSIIFWNATSNDAIYFSDERHGVIMDGSTHSYLHTTLGTRWISGLGINGTFNPGGVNDADIQLSIENGSIRDEDLIHSIYDTGLQQTTYDLTQDLSPIAQLPVLYRLGTANEWYIKQADNYPFIYSGTAGYSGTRIPYNHWTGSSWQLTEIANNRFGLLHIMATNDIRHPIIVLQGLQAYQNKPAGVDAAISELKRYTNLPFAEMTPIGTLIFQTSDSFTNSQKISFQLTSEGNTYVDWRFINNVSVNTQGINDHGSLAGLNDDDHIQYALAGVGSTRTFNFNDLYNINDPTRTLSDNGKLYGLFWNNTNTEYDINTFGLHDLSDVNVSNSAGIDGYGLTYNQSTGKWIASPVAPVLKLYSENPSSPAPPSALGINSIALGSGAQTDVSAPNSLAIGEQSLARIRGGVVQANGRFGSSGDAQVGRYILRTHTINSTPTEAFIDGTNGSVRLVLPDNSTWTFKATITGHRTDINNGHAGYTINGVIYRNSGANTTAIQGSIIKNVIAESNPAWDINITADSTNGSLKITVIGETAKTIRWVAYVETVEITN